MPADLSGHIERFFQDHPDVIAPLDFHRDFAIGRIQADRNDLYHVHMQRLHHGIPVYGTALMLRLTGKGIVKSHQTYVDPRTKLPQANALWKITPQEIQALLRGHYGAYQVIRQPEKFWLLWNQAWHPVIFTEIQQNRSGHIFSVAYHADTAQLVYKRQQLSSAPPLPGITQQCATKEHTLLDTKFDGQLLSTTGCIPIAADQMWLLYDAGRKYFTAPDSLGTIDWSSIASGSIPPESYNAGPNAPILESAEISKTFAQTYRSLVLHQNAQHVFEVLESDLGHDRTTDAWAPAALTIDPNPDGWSGITDGAGIIAVAEGYEGNTVTMGHEMMHNIEHQYYSGPPFGGYCDSTEATKTNGLEEGVASALGQRIEKILLEKYGFVSSPWLSQKISSFDDFDAAFDAKDHSNEKYCSSHAYGGLIETLLLRIAEGMYLCDFPQPCQFLSQPVGHRLAAALLLRMVQYNYPWHWSYPQFAEGLLQACFDAVGIAVGGSATTITAADCTQVEKVLTLHNLIPPNAKGVDVSPYFQTKIIDYALGKMQFHESSLVNGHLLARYQSPVTNLDSQLLAQKLAIKKTTEQFNGLFALHPLAKSQLFDGGWFISTIDAFSENFFEIPANGSTVLSSDVPLALPIDMWQRPVNYGISIYVAKVPPGYAYDVGDGIKATSTKLGIDYALAGSSTSAGKTDARTSGGLNTHNPIPTWLKSREYTFTFTFKNSGTRPIYGYVPLKIFSNTDAIETFTGQVNDYHDGFLQMFIEAQHGLIAPKDYQQGKQYSGKAVEIIGHVINQGYAASSDIAAMKALVEELLIIHANEQTDDTAATGSDNVEDESNQEPLFPLDYSNAKNSPLFGRGADRSITRKADLFNPRQPFGKQFHIPPLDRDNTSFPIVDPGKTFEITVKYQAMEGSTIYLFIDPYQQVRELDESNNIFSITLPKHNEETDMLDVLPFTLQSVTDALVKFPPASVEELPSRQSIDPKSFEAPPTTPIQPPGKPTY